MVVLCLGCRDSQKEVESNVEDKQGQVRLMTLDPGHFHAALVQKTMYNGVDSTIYVFAPEGPEVNDFLNKIESYNSRSEDPTHWNVDSYFGADYLEK